MEGFRMNTKQLDKTEYAAHLREVGLNDTEILNVLINLTERGIF